jgi:hypothetical protein
MVSAMQPLAVVTAGAGVRCPGFPAGDPPVFPVACCSALFGVDRPPPNFFPPRQSVFGSLRR